MRSKKFTCEICETVAELDSDDRLAASRPRGWFYVVVERAPGWFTQKNVEPVSGVGFRYLDAWPGASRWHENVMPPQPVHLDFCSADCTFEGMRRLHEGARVVSFEVPEPLTAQEISFVLRYRSDRAEEAEAAHLTEGEGASQDVSEAEGGCGGVQDG